MKRIRILIVDDIAATRESIRRLLQFEEDLEVVGEAGNGSEALRLAESLRPDIVLMDINMPEMDGIRTTELLALRVPSASVIIMSVQGEQAYLRRAMMAGAREYITKPFSGDELAGTIAKVFEMEQRRREALGTVTPVAASTQTKQRYGRIISFFSVKGGVGKTSLATNLAVQLAMNGKWRVLLIDLNLQFGDAAIFLNLSPRRTIADLAQGGSFTIDEIQAHLLTHSSGLQLLAAPTRPEHAELVTAEQVEKILSTVKSNFDFIICDNVSRFEEVSLTSFDAAEQIWLVVSMDVPTLKNTKLSLELLDTLHHLDKVRLIMNRASREMGITTDDVEKSLDFRVFFEVPSDGKALVTAVNHGIPFVLSHQQSKAAETIRQMAEILTDNTDQAGQAKGRPDSGGVVPKKGIRKLFGF